ncbi:hypothetical protein KY289_020694 [Solanum tuberosum]|nr:hypothetical protein KY289_020694 [Solanum tuberosum]
MTSPIEESVGVARRCWINFKKESTFALYTPFVVCLASGTLNIDTFRHYIAQDVHFLKAFVQGQARYDELDLEGKPLAFAGKGFELETSNMEVPSPNHWVTPKGLVLQLHLPFLLFCDLEWQLVRWHIGGSLVGTTLDPILSFNLEM